MECTNCGQEVPDRANVCGYCGHRLKAVGPAKAPAFPEAQPGRLAARGSRWWWLLLVAPAVALAVFIRFPRSEGPPAVMAPSAPAQEAASGQDPVVATDSRPAVVTSAPGQQVTPSPVDTDVPHAADLWQSCPRPKVVSITASNRIVPVDRPVILKSGWIADSESLVRAYIDEAQIVIKGDAGTFRIGAEHWGPVEEFRDFDEDGDLDYRANFDLPVGFLEPGSHKFTIETVLPASFTDGMDIDGDGFPDEYSSEIDLLTIDVFARVASSAGPDSDGWVEIWFDDFSDPGNSEFRDVVRDGAVFFSIDGDSGTSPYVAGSAGDFRLAFDARVTDARSPFSTWGVELISWPLGLVNNLLGFTDWQEVIFSPATQNFTIWRNNQDFEMVKSDPILAASFSTGIGVTNHVELVGTGSLISIRVNGEEIIAFPHARDGACTHLYWTIENDVDVELDNVQFFTR